MSEKSEKELAEEVLKKYDSDADTMQYTGLMAKFVSALAITFSIFQLYTATFGVLDAQLQRAVHLGFGLALVYLLYPSRKRWSRTKVHPLDVVLAILGAASPAYIVLEYQQLVLRSGTVTTPDLAVGLIGILLVVEATRRVVGIPMVTVVLCFIAYAFAGPYMPGVLAHRGLTLNQLVGHLYFTTEGIFGIPLGVSSTFIFLFILFGAYLESTGLGKFFIDLANSIAGWASGGPAKVAVLSSGLMGTVSGSSVANVVGTGSLTIPMMKKLGYHKNFAGAVEAAASTGGQLMPPVMGAAAFLMAEFVGVPYIDIVKAAVVPALLYFTGVWLGVHFEAKRSNLKGLPREQLPKFGRLFIERGHLALPLVVIVYLLVSGYTPMRAALVAIVLSIVCSALRKSTRMKPIEIVRGLDKGARNVLSVLVACASAGIVIGVVTKTGVGLKLSWLFTTLANGSPLVAILLVGLISMILGMGLASGPAYIVTAIAVGPALADMGFPLMTAHFIMMWFSIDSEITPPVGLASIVGAGIANADPMKTMFTAFKYAKALYILPILFYYRPALLLQSSLFDIALTFVTVMLGLIAFAAVWENYLMRRTTLLERILLLGGALLLFIPGHIWDFAGIGLFIIVYCLQRYYCPAGFRQTA